MKIATTFPSEFDWGTATAAHQVEGGNTNNDWWAFEHAKNSGCSESSGDACDSWHHWVQDVDLVASLGFNSYRFSVEWSRIEPAENEISSVALDHYCRVADYLLERGINPVVTLHHFTTPRWLVELGGWENPSIVDYFTKFCSIVCEALKGRLSRICTINEPNVVATMGWYAGMFPPGKQDSKLSLFVAENLMASHRSAVQIIRSIVPDIPVGLTLSMTDYQCTLDGEFKRNRIRELSEDIYFEATSGDDFIGVQAYTRMLIGKNGWIGTQPGIPTVDMGYEFYPEALEACLRRAWEVTQGSIPLIVTENGVGIQDDSMRIIYISRALEGVLRAISDGVDVRGYTYWSLLDNFEWALGFTPRFGLCSVDRTTFERTPKPSAFWLANVVSNNALT